MKRLLAQALGSELAQAGAQLKSLAQEWISQLRAAVAESLAPAVALEFVERVLALRELAIVVSMALAVSLPANSRRQLAQVKLPAVTAADSLVTAVSLEVARLKSVALREVVELVAMILSV